MQIAKVTGHISWWVFVIARLMSELALTLPGAPRRYADYVGTDPGWTAYTPLTGASTGWRDPFTQANIVTTVGVVAAVVTVIAVLVQAVLVRRLWPGVTAVASTIVGGTVVLWALAHRDGYLGVAGPSLPLVVVFVLVLFGVGVRELGSRLSMPAG